MSTPVEIKSLRAFKHWVENNLSLFKAGHLILLKGDLGAGKTTLVSLAVEALGGDPQEVSSPTFALHHVYEASSLMIDHMDLYRLENDFDLESSGFFEVLEHQSHLRFIEWSERIPLEIYQQTVEGAILEIEIKRRAEPDSAREISVRNLSRA